MSILSSSAPLLAAAFMRLIPIGIANIIYSIVNFYVIIIIVWAILSWFRARGGFVNDIYQVLDKIVDPFVGLFRKIIPTAGGMDFSPFIAIILLQLVTRLLISL